MKMKIKTEHRYFIRDAQGNTICQVRTERQGQSLIKRSVKTLGDTLELMDEFEKTMAFRSRDDESCFAITRKTVSDQLAMWKNAELYDVTKKSLYTPNVGSRNCYVIVFPDMPGFTRFAQSFEGAQNRIAREIEYAKRNISDRPEDKFFKVLLKRWQGAKILTREEFEKSVEKEDTEKCQ